jgi:hypothetical protein
MTINKRQTLLARVDAFLQRAFARRPRFPFAVLAAFALGCLVCELANGETLDTPTTLPPSGYCFGTLGTTEHWYAFCEVTETTVSLRGPKGGNFYTAFLPARRIIDATTAKLSVPGSRRVQIDGWGVVFFIPASLDAQVLPTHVDESTADVEVTVERSWVRIRLSSLKASPPR